MLPSFVAGDMRCEAEIFPIESLSVTLRTIYELIHLFLFPHHVPLPYWE